MTETSKTQFIVTIDTETYLVDGNLVPFDPNIYGTFPDGTYGTERIMDVCDQYGARATFFVDVYMHHRYGHDPVAELCAKIHERGHDVQLHTHTSWLPGSRSDLLNHYEYDEQVEILTEGRDLIEEWTGRTPRAFRAGAYGANLDTIRALKKTGFTIDSSYFPGHRNCELSRQIDSGVTNSPFLIEGILELPVTTYWLLNTPLKRKNSKVDFNACSLSELQNVIPKFIRGRMKYVVLFLHSFSFIKWQGSGIERNLSPLKRFERTMAAIAERDDAGFVAVDQVQDLRDDSTGGPDFVPTLNPIRILSRAARRLGS